METVNTIPAVSDPQIETAKNPLVDKGGNEKTDTKAMHRRVASGPVQVHGKGASSILRAASGPVPGLMSGRSLRSVAERAGWKPVGSRLSGHVNGHLPIPQKLPLPPDLNLSDYEQKHDDDVPTSTEEKKGLKNLDPAPEPPPQGHTSSSHSSTSGSSHSSHASSSPSVAPHSASGRNSDKASTSAGNFSEVKEWPLPPASSSTKRQMRRTSRTRDSSKSWTGGGWDVIAPEEPKTKPPVVELQVPTLIKACIENSHKINSDDTLVMTITNDNHPDGCNCGDPNHQIALRVSCKFEVYKPPCVSQASKSAESSGTHQISTSENNISRMPSASSVLISASDSNLRTTPMSVQLSSKISPASSPDRVRLPPTSNNYRNNINHSLGSNPTSSKIFESLSSLFPRKSTYVSASGPINMPLTKHDVGKVSHSQNDLRRFPSSNPITSSSSALTTSKVEIPSSAQALIVITCPTSQAESSPNPRSSPSRTIRMGGNFTTNEVESSTENYNARAYRLPPPPLTDTCRSVPTKS